jgi:hypothetical protein
VFLPVAVVQDVVSTSTFITVVVFLCSVVFLLVVLDVDLVVLNVVLTVVAQVVV